jgi:hypothetical protein
LIVSQNGKDSRLNDLRILRQGSRQRQWQKRTLLTKELASDFPIQQHAIGGRLQQIYNNQKGEEDLQMD